MRKLTLFVFLLACYLWTPVQATDLPANAHLAFDVELPDVIMAGVESEIKVKVVVSEVDSLFTEQFFPAVQVNGEPYPLEISDGEGSFSYSFEEGKQTLAIAVGDFKVTKEAEGIRIPRWLSIIPPLMAILMALLFREVITALFVGIFTGAAMIGYYHKGFSGIGSGLMATVDTYIINALNDWGHLAVIIFSMTIGSIVAVISKNGGMQGVVDKIARYAKDARSGQLATWFLGVAIFFDDYANTLVVGNTMRPVTDRLKISREKLSYLVDSTAAPIAAIAFVTTWVGAELGYIQDGIDSISGIGEDESVYGIFISSLRYSFYPIFTLAFMLMLIWKKRDFGPMHKAELRARTTGKVVSDGKVDQGTSEQMKELALAPKAKPYWINAVLPIAVVIVGTIIGLFYTGWDSEVWNDANLSFSRKLSNIIGASDSYTALLWSSITGLLVAILLSVTQKIMSVVDTIDATLAGFKTMLPTMIVLILAWSLALVTEHLHTADFLTGLLGDSVSPIILPALTFILAAIVAFSTGSSWGTMAILYPLILPATWQICEQSGYDYNHTMMIFYNVVSTVLAGAVFGDHCSPISDTTILSSMASSCDHISHVRTQLPYAVTVALVSVLVGTFPAALGVPSWMSLIAGLALLFIIVQKVGKPVPAA